MLLCLRIHPHAPLPPLNDPAGGGKKEPEKPLSVVLQEFEASLDANVRKRRCAAGLLFPFWLSHLPPLAFRNFGR